MLTYQIWSLLPGYWTNSTELTQSFKVEYLVVGAHLPALWSLLSRLLHQPHWPCRELQGRVVAGAHLSDLVPPPWLLHQPHWPYPESFKVQYYRCCWYRTVLRTDPDLVKTGSQTLSWLSLFSFFSSSQQVFCMLLLLSRRNMWILF